MSTSASWDSCGNGKVRVRLLQSAPANPPLSPSEARSFRPLCAVLFGDVPGVDHVARVRGARCSRRSSPCGDRPLASASQPWDRVVGAVRDIGGLQDLPRWSLLQLREASAHHAPIPGPLLKQYVQSVTWRRSQRVRLTTSTVDSLLAAWRTSVSSRSQECCYRHSGTVRLRNFEIGSGSPASADLRDVALDRLARLGAGDDRRLHSGGELAERGSLQPAAAGSLLAGRLREQLGARRGASLAGSGCNRSDRCSRPGLPEAGIGESRRVAAAGIAAMACFPAKLPLRPRLCCPGTSQSTGYGVRGLPIDHIVRRLLADAETRPRCRRRLHARNFAGRSEVETRDRSLLSEHNRRVVDVVSLVGYFTSQPPYATPRSSRPCGGCGSARLADGPLPGGSTTLRWRRGCWASSGYGPPAHAGKGCFVADRCWTRRFLEFYARSAEEDVATAKPDHAATLITVWRQPGLKYGRCGAEDEARALSNDLLRPVLASGLARASRRHLERIGEVRSWAQAIWPTAAA